LGEGLGATGEWEAQHDLAMYVHIPEDQPYPGLHPQQRGQQGKGGDSAPLPHSGETPQESCVQLWSPQHRTELELWERGQRRPQQWCEGWSPSARRTGWESLGLVSLGKRRLRGHLIAAIQDWKEAYKKAGEGLFTRVCGGRTRDNGFKEGRFRLAVGKKFLTVRVVRPWSRLPREAVAALFPAVFKARLDRALSSMV